MSKWAVHKYWDSTLGIPSQVSDYMQKAIDSKGPSDKKIVMPEDFIKHCEEEKIIVHRHKNWAIVDLHYNLHDRARDKIIQAEDLKFLLTKGENYVRAYYLHLILDYLNHPTIREFIKQGDTISDCIDRYMKNKAVTIPGTSQHLVYVTDFLKSHSLEVKDNLKL